MAEMSDKLTIRLMIGKQSYPFNVQRDQEETFRKAGKLINKKLQTYETNWPGQGIEKYLSTVALDVAVQLIRQENRQDTLPFMDTLSELTKEIEELSDIK